MNRSGWQFLLGMFTVASLLEVAAWGHGQAFTPLFLERELGVAPEDVPRWTGVLAAAPLLIAAPLSPFWGVIADRWSYRLVVLRCYLLGAVAFLLSAFCQDPWQFLAIRLLLGFTFGSNVVVVALMAKMVPQRRLGFAIGITQMVFPVGNSVGPLLGSGFIEWFGLRGMFVADAVLVAIGFVLILALFHEPEHSAHGGESVLASLGSVLRLVWRRPSLRLSFFLFFLFGGGWTLVIPFVPVLIARVYRGDDVALAIGIVLAIYGAVAGIAAPLFGRLADRIGPVPLIIVNMAGLLVMCAGLALATTLEQVTLAMLVGAAPFGAGNTTIYAYVARHAPPEHIAGVMSLSPTARHVAMFITPLIGAAVSVFSLEAVFATGAVIYVAALALSLALLRLPMAPPALARAETAD